MVSGFHQVDEAAENIFAKIAIERRRLLSVDISVPILSAARRTQARWEIAKTTLNRVGTLAD
jgi:hypothetical protein